MADADRPVEENGDGIRFVLNGELVTIGDIEPTRSVLQYLREERRLTGTKEGCAEGDCGACTVVVAELQGDDLAMKAVNACIQFVPTLDGKALFTVEHLRQADGSLHPVQQALVDHHGSQCGFCTPGFVMSLWNVYNTHQAVGSQPDDAALRTALSGNLCRCTGYRPILEAGHAMFEPPAVALDQDELRAALQKVRRERMLSYSHGNASFHAPRSLAELTELRAELPEATILAGCTDIGLWVNKQFRDLGDIIYIGEVAELQAIRDDGETLWIGAGASLTDAYAALVRHYPEAREMWERFASVPIRNAGTLGGNVANGSPIGDSMPWLIAVGAKVALRSTQGVRTLLLEDLYLDYMKKDLAADEIVEAIEVPLPKPEQAFRTYKVAKRYDSDISAVCAAFSLTMDGDNIAEARIAFGGMAATPKRAGQCEQALVGKPWNEATAKAAKEALAEDYQPLSDMRASADNRLLSAQNLLQRFYLETRPVDPLPAEKLSVFAVEA
ncbi:MAG: xanthine dehydrogenase small subunit [Alphaproteobacteria bacterium]|nr:xanthine dehydrogenase small subunit [Alphaproteobacteria bacterium]